MAISELDATLVTVGKPVDGGSIWISFADSPTLPTDASTKMSTLTDFESLGELSSEGIVRSDSKSTTTHKGWHGTPLLVSDEGTDKTFKFTAVEYARGTVAKMKYGPDNVTVGTDGQWTQINETENLPLTRVSIVFDVLESNGYLDRKVIKRAMITGLEDTGYTQGDLIGVGVSFAVLSAGDGTGVDVVHYRAKPSTLNGTGSTGA